MIKRNKNGVKNGYLIKAVIGRLKNGDIYGIVKVIQHPNYQKMSSKKVVKYCNKALGSGFPIYGSQAQVPFFVMKWAAYFLVGKTYWTDFNLLHCIPLCL